jgi:hypothetical protein
LEQRAVPPVCQPVPLPSTPAEAMELHISTLR